MAQLAEAIPQFLLRIFAPALGVCLAAWLIMLFAQLFSGKRHSCRLGKPVWAGLAALAIVCTTLCGKNTNGVQGVGGPLLQFNPPLALTVTPEDITNGWRVAEETEAESFAQPSANAITNEPWRRRGAFDDALRIPANGWSYPYATGVTVLARGELRTSIRTRDFPPAFAQGLSLLPLVNWPQLPEGRRESVFWYDATPSNSLLTTWWNATLGRDATNPVNFQAELFPDGGFTYRYEDRTVRHARVWPFDWDDDGLENTVDPDPLTPGPDAHGTNAEWYNTVCSNVFSAVEGGGTGTTGILPVDDVSVLPWREGVNSNAYYFVDVVTEHGPAPIYITGDRDSRLGNPVVVALAGVTNRVPLLIGIDYAITSPVSFAVSFPVDYMHPEVLTNILGSVSIRWPLEFTITSDGNGGYVAGASPYDPGCTFVWGDGGSNGGLRSGTSLCEYSASGGWICFNCGGNGDSGCHGCSVSGCAMLENAHFDLPSIWCGCWYEDTTPDPGSTTNTPSGPPGGPSITLSLDNNIVLFESTYTNSPGVSVDRHSTQAELTVEYDNPTDSSLTVALTVQSGQNRICMRDSSSGPRFTGWTDVCPAKTSGMQTFFIEGLGRSEGQGDVRLYGTIGSGSDSAHLTVIEVVLTPEVETGSDLIHRHQFGVCEKVWCEAYPASMGVSWRCSGNGSLVPSGAHYKHQVPFDALNYALTAEIGDAAIPLAVQALFPTDISVINNDDHSVVVLTNAISAGEAGCVGIQLPLFCSPTNVSFANIEVREMETPAALFTRYFATTNWIGLRDHQGSAISADWFVPGAENYFADDEAYMGYCAEPWLGGGNLEWQIPDACRPVDVSVSGTNIFLTTEQAASLTADGTVRVMKFGYMVERMTNETINLWRPYED